MRPAGCPARAIVPLAWNGSKTPHLWPERRRSAHPSPAERQSVDRNRLGARYLGADDSQACPSRRRRRSARIAAIVDRDHHRRAKCANGRLIAGMLLLIAHRLDDGARDDREG